MSKKNKEKLFVEIDEQLKKDLIEKTEKDKTTTLYKFKVLEK